MNSWISFSCRTNAVAASVLGKNVYVFPQNSKNYFQILMIVRKNRYHFKLILGKAASITV